MSLDDALFLVDRGGTNYHSKGSDIADRIQVGDKVLVQRNNERFYTWYGKPSDAETPYLTRRVSFNNQCFPDNNGDNNQHTDQPGEVNLSYWWGCGGPSPIREWRNIRNKNVSAFVDLDGEPFPLQNQSLISVGSVCRITSDAGWKSWHEIAFTGANDGLAFKAQYTNDDGRERTDLKVEGVANTYKPANGEILTFDFFDPADITVFPDIADDDLLLAWDGTKNRRVTGANFKSLFWNPPSFPAGFEVVAEHPDGGGDFWFLVNEIIALRFYGKEPGTTEQDYIDAYDVETIFTQSSENFLTLYTDVMHTPQWCVYSTKQNINSLLPVTVETKWTNKKDPTDFRRFITSLTLSRSTAREDALLDQAKECHREAYAEYQRCKLLCETDYCQSICDSQFEETVDECYQSRGLTAPLLSTPPPRA